MLQFAPLNLCILAKMEAAPPEYSTLALMLLCLFIFAAAALLAFFPIRSAKIRDHRHAEIILAASILWALLTAASILYPIFARSQFNADHQTEMLAGNIDPTDLSGQPQWPWPIWLALAAIYAVLVFTATRGEPKKTEPPPESPGE